MTETPEQQLELAIWRAFRVYRITTTHPLEFVESVMIAARAYGAGDSDTLTAARRMVLHEATRPRRRSRAVFAGGSGEHPAAPDLESGGSGAVPLGGATLSTGPSVPPASQDPANLRPQAVDNSRLAAALAKAQASG